MTYYIILILYMYMAMYRPVYTVLHVYSHIIMKEHVQAHVCIRDTSMNMNIIDLVAKFSYCIMHDHRCTLHIMHSTDIHDIHTTHVHTCM